MGLALLKLHEKRGPCLMPWDEMRLDTCGFEQLDRIAGGVVDYDLVAGDAGDEVAV